MVCFHNFLKTHTDLKKKGVFVDRYNILTMNDFYVLWSTIHIYALETLQNFH